MAERTPPVWGTPDSRPSPATATVQDRPREQQVRWQHNPRGIAPRVMSPDLLRRQAKVAMVVNLIVLFCAFGLCSAPGAYLAVRARDLAHQDPVRAQRRLMWSWLLLASNLLLYVLLALVIGIVVLSIIFR